MNTDLKKEIEKAIRETLVVSNKQSIHIAVDKIYKLINGKENNPLRKS